MATSPLVIDLSKYKTIVTPPAILFPTTVVTDKYTAFSTAISGFPMPPAPILSIPYPSLWHHLFDHMFYTQLLGSQSFIPEDPYPFVSSLSEGGLSADTRVSYDPPTISHSWTLFVPGGRKRFWAVSCNTTDSISSPKRLELEGLLTVLF